MTINDRKILNMAVMSLKEQFESLQSDFYHYMVNWGGISPKTSRDYVARLRFLSEFYLLDSSITEEYIEIILNKEESRRLERDVYATRKSISDFRSGLRKFLAFVNSDYRKMYEDSVLTEIEAVESSSMLSVTEKMSIVQSRVGQGTFRQNLIDYWGGCAITGYRRVDVLVASHIKPWRDSENNERLDVFNGLLLSPNYDKLFDRGYLTFNLKGKIEYSKVLSQNDKLLLGLKDGVVLKRIDERHKIYLKYHNEKCFIG